MLLRHQVLITDWQTENLKMLATKSDFSFSEMIRVVLCQGLLCSTLSLYPEFKSSINKPKLEKIVRDISDPKVSTEIKHKLVSEIYFEARKAAEFLEKRNKK
jgi:hypothetical protein